MIEDYNYQQQVQLQAEQNQKLTSKTNSVFGGQTTNTNFSASEVEGGVGGGYGGGRGLGSAGASKSEDVSFDMVLQGRTSGGSNDGAPVGLERKETTSKNSTPDKRLREFLQDKIVESAGGEVESDVGNNLSEVVKGAVNCPSDDVLAVLETANTTITTMTSEKIDLPPTAASAVTMRSGSCSSFQPSTSRSNSKSEESSDPMMLKTAGTAPSLQIPHPEQLLRSPPQVQEHHQHQAQQNLIAFPGRTGSTHITQEQAGYLFQNSPGSDNAPYNDLDADFGEEQTAATRFILRPELLLLTNSHLADREEESFYGEILHLDDPKFTYETHVKPLLRAVVTIAEAVVAIAKAVVTIAKAVVAIAKALDGIYIQKTPKMTDPDVDAAKVREIADNCVLGVWLAATDTDSYN
eukprot:g15277.t1